MNGDELTEKQRHRIEMVIDRTFGGLHNAPKIHWQGFYAEVNAPSDRLATFDFAQLTSLVFVAHDWCVRVSIGQSGPGLVKLRLYPRDKREGSMNERHPTLAQAVTQWRETQLVEDGL